MIELEPPVIAGVTHVGGGTHLKESTRDEWRVWIESFARLSVKKLYPRRVAGMRKKWVVEVGK